MRIVVHKKAEEEVEAAVHWYEERQQGLGTDLLIELDRAFVAIAESPKTWPAWPDVKPSLGIRRFLLSRFPYGVAYRESEDRLMIIAIPHMHRRPAYWKQRAVTDD